MHQGFSAHVPAKLAIVGGQGVVVTVRHQIRRLVQEIHSGAHLTLRQYFALSFVILRSFHLNFSN